MNAQRQTVLVTGATGRVGGHVVAQLTGSDVRVRALTRAAAASTQFGPNVEVVEGDLTQPDSLASAVQDVDAAFLVFPSITGDESARELVTILAANVPRIVYLSSNGVPDEPDINAEPDGGIIGSHAYLEGLIASSATEYTFLRPSGFAANTLGWAEQIQQSDVLRWYLPDLTRSLIHEADIAAVAVRALAEDGHNGRAHHITGPQQLTQVEQLQAIGDALERQLRFDDIGVDRAVAELFTGLPPQLATQIVQGQSALAAHPEAVTDTVEQLTGRPARSFAQWARDHVADFTRSSMSDVSH